MYQSDDIAEEKPAKTLIVKDPEENVDDYDNMPIIAYRKKGTHTDFEATSAGIIECVFFHL